ncbi:hypothetical protein [Serratia marcescens]|uniref:hypothetical protein n=1 Tax=Serratia marcescens TaxID=615 RepID=UPI001F14F076|nr:hypothetical protein [Serratia marcescens]MDP8728373.1 hypothetical protein [Serratia marcescens]
MAKDVKKVIRDLNKWRIKEDDKFSKRVTKASKLASVELQRHINRNTDRPTAFTKNAVGFQFKIGKGVTTNRIYIKDIQAKYLGHLIDDETPVNKFNPLPKTTNNYGNIAGLKTMRNLKAVVQKHKGTNRTILIKTNAKKNKRLIAIFKRNSQRRKYYGSWPEISNKVTSQVNNAVKASYK